MKRSISILVAILFAMPLFSQEYVNIPDANFLAALIEEGVDTNEDGLISNAEAEAVTRIFLSGKGISDMTGIDAFVNLDTLQCGSNQLTSLALSKNIALIYLSCRLNNLTNLDVSKNTALHNLVCFGNQLTSLDVSNNSELRHLHCHDNLLTSLDVSNKTNLLGLTCFDNLLTTLDVTNDTALVTLGCSRNSLTSLDVTTNINLRGYSSPGQQDGGLDCSHNKLTSLDVSNNFSLTVLACNGNQLTSLDVSNNPLIWSHGGWQHQGRLYIGEMITLQEVCIPSCLPWDGEGCLPDTAQDLLEHIDTTGSPNVCFNTICDGNCPEVETVSINLNIPQEGISIYPNPTNSYLIIETDQPDHHSIEIVSLSGQMIYRTEMEGNSKQIDLTPFSKGIYFVTVRSKEFVRTEKVVKL